MPSSTYPQDSPTLSVALLLQSPRVLSRDLTDLAAKHFVADRVAAHGTPESVASGAAVFQRSESIYTDGDPEEVNVRAAYPRTGWSEALLTAAVHKYGLEVPVSWEAKRRNQLDVLTRAKRKIANSVVKFVDTTFMNMIMDGTTDGTGVLTGAVTAAWDAGGAKIYNDIVTAQEAIMSQDEGYVPDTLIVNPIQAANLRTDATLIGLMPRETVNENPVLNMGELPTAGIRQILRSATVTDGKVIVASSMQGSTITDERPAGDEGYAAYNPGPNQSVVWAKVYTEDSNDTTIVRGMRAPAMYITEPKSFYVLTGA